LAHNEKFKIIKTAFRVLNNDDLKKELSEKLDTVLKVAV